MKREKLDPVDLMLRGEMDAAARIYVKRYTEAVAEGDNFIGPHLLSQLHFCVAGKQSGRIPEDSAAVVERMVMEELHKKGIDVDKSNVKIDIETAKNSVESARRNSEGISRRWV